jgi:type I restriction enzyme S subunit
MSVYPEYKECDGDWIKEIPVDWDIVRGKYLFEIKKRIVGEVGHNVLSITQKGIKVKDTESGDGQLSMDYSKYQIVQPGDFAMNHMDLLTGYVDISKFNGVTSPDYRVFTAKKEAGCSRFFLYLFQMGYSNKIFFKYGQGASHLGRWRLPTEEFNNFCFPCPPKEGREQIADFLDHEIAKIDSLIEKQQQLIKRLK